MNSVSKTSGVDKYSTFGMREAWIKSFFDLFEEYFIDYGGLGHKQISAMINWLREAELVDSKEKKVSPLAVLLRPIYENNPHLADEIIWINLCFNSAVINTYVTKLTPFDSYTKEDLVANMQDTYPNIGVSTLGNPVGAMINMFENSSFGYSIEEGVPADGNLQMGVISGSGRKGNKKVAIIGGVPVSAFAISYLLYKVAESENRYEFRVSEFFEKGNVNPKTVFNIKRDDFNKALRSSEELGFLKADLVAGLENIHLDPNLTSLSIIKTLAARYEM